METTSENKTITDIHKKGGGDYNTRDSYQRKGEDSIRRKDQKRTAKETPKQ